MPLPCRSRRSAKGQGEVKLLEIKKTPILERAVSRAVTITHGFISP